MRLPPPAPLAALALLSALAALLAPASAARAEDDPAQDSAQDPAQDSAQDPAQDPTQGDTLTVTAPRDPHDAPSEELEGRAAATLRDVDVREQVARSTPEALRGVAGTYVQQTAHGQASAYIRGRTGRQTLLMVDGFRLNHALFRQGPNQYLFTIDPLSVERLEVLRGGASVWLGANALSGAVLVRSKGPSLRAPASAALTLLRTGADGGLGGRAEADLTLARGFGLFVGAGGVTRGPLEASGPLPLKPGLTAAQRIEKSVPRFEADGRTQLGTGYDALSADVAARLQLRGALRGEWTAAARLFRQYNAPRTDLCPPSEAPEGWCLTYNEQFRTHAYTRLALRLGLALAERAEAGVSFQRQHERRTNDRVHYQNIGRDAVRVWEARLKARTRPLDLAGGALRLHYGLDGSAEGVESKAWTRLVRSSVTRQDARGQYLDDSAYLRGEGWAGARWRRAGAWGAWGARLGARLSAARAEAPGDERSSSRAVSRGWAGPTYGGGLTWTPPAREGGPQASPLSLHLNVEQGFSAPNLDDLTARQLTGQGYQVENPALAPERATTYELGARLRARGVEAELWGFALELRDGIERRDATCPPADFGCQGSRTAPPFTLINLPGAAWVLGAEHALTVRLPLRLSLREHASYAWGEGPSPLPSEPGLTRPLSRIPPLNGAVALRWSAPEGALRGAPLSGYLGYEARWALAATRLSFGDQLDQRIPYGGTPASLTHGALFGLRWGAHELLGVVENLTDVPYRTHGSSVNGAARSLNVSLRLAL